MISRAFTLIELLVVVAIIGILAAVGVVAYNGYTHAAKAAATKAQHKTISNAIAAKAIKCSTLGGQVESFDVNGKTYLFNCPTDISSFKAHMDSFIYGGGFKNPYGNSNGSRCRLNVVNCDPPGFINGCIEDRGMMGLRLDINSRIIESCSAYLSTTGIEYIKTTISY